MPDQFSKKELAVRLREALNELDKVTDEIIVTYLDENEEGASQQKSDPT